MSTHSIDELRNRFFYHKPGPEAVELHTVVSAKCFELACSLTAICPQGRDLNIALTKLEEVRMRANSAIAMTQPLAD